MAAAIPAIAMAVTAATAVYGGYTAYTTAKANEKIAENEAKYQRQKAAAEARRQFDRTQKLMGAQRVGYASSGVSLMSGSVQDVFASTLQESAEDMAVIKMGGDIESNRANAQASNYANQATASIVSTVGQVGSSVLAYSAYKQGDKNA